MPWPMKAHRLSLDAASLETAERKHEVKQNFTFRCIGEARTSSTLPNVRKPGLRLREHRQLRHRRETEGRDLLQAL